MTRGRVFIQGDSPAIVLVRHALDWAPWPSWRFRVDVHRAALALAITAGLRFDVSDFKELMMMIRADFGAGIEHWYSLACASIHRSGRPNISAARSYEAWAGRRPFRGVPWGRSGERRFAVGTLFSWYGAMAEVTSFAPGGETLNAVVRQRPERCAVDRLIDLDDDKSDHQEPVTAKRLRVTRAELLERTRLQVEALR